MDRKLLILAMLLCFAASSCMKEKLAATYNSQEASIDKYITGSMYVKRSGVSEKTGNDTTWTDTLRIVRNGGVNRLVQKEGLGEELKPGGNIAFYYAGYIFKGSKNSNILFATNRQEIAAEKKWELTDASYEMLQLDLAKTRLIEGLRKGLIGVKGGEECEIMFSGQYAFGDNEFGTIPANSALLYYIWVEAVSNE
jgi:FKBP-type peptidyl-prolyl cis-trans isomerase